MDGQSDPPERQRVRTTLISIVNASKRLQNVALGSSWGGPVDPNVLQTVTQLDKIVAACGTILAKSLQSSSILDPRLERWLGSDTPDACLGVLTEMEKLVATSQSTTWWGRISSTIRAVTHAGNHIPEATTLFRDRRGVFQFLFALGDPERNSKADRAGLRSGVASGVSVGGRSGGMLARTRVGVYTLGAGNGERIEEQKDDLEVVDPKKLGSVLSWLSGFDCNERHADVVSVWQRDTCTWLPRTNQYKMWRISENSFLWLHGKAGAGKTVLACVYIAFVIETLRKTMQDGEPIVFFYCDFRNERIASAASVMCSILSQLLRKVCDDTNQDLIQLVDDMIKGQTDGTLMRRPDHIVPLVSRVAKQFGRQPLVIIDALDECSDVENLLRALRKVVELGGVRLFVTSRPLPIVKDKFHRLPSISMDRMLDAVSADIKLHLIREVECDRRLRILDAELKTEIYATLQHGADGMFRWIQCQLDTLRKCATREDLLAALHGLPNGLEETYERILRAIDPQSSEGKLAVRALVWLIAVLQPLRLIEVLEALSIDLKGQRLDRNIAPVHGLALLDVLGCLVMYNEETCVVNLSHFTVKEYLVGSLCREKFPLHHINLRMAHVQVSQLCMGYLAALIKHCPSPEANGATSQPPPLLSYVFSYGFDHLKHVGSGNVVVLDAMISLRADIQRHPAEWARIIELALLPPGLTWLTPEHDFIIHILITSLPEPSLRAFLGRLPFKSYSGTSPLIYAAYFGRFEHAETLLSSGINVNSTGLGVDSPHQVSPLEAAFYRGHRPLVDLFLVDQMASVPSRLFSAVFNGQRWDYDLYVVTKLFLCDEFPEWVVDGQHEELVLCTLGRNWARLVESTEEDVLVVLRRTLQAGCELAAPYSLRLMLRITWHANVPMSSRTLLSHGTALVKELVSQGFPVTMLTEKCDSMLRLAFGRCRHGSSCWTGDCKLCSAFLRSTDFQRCMPTDLLFVGRRGAGKTSLINMITSISPYPDGLPITNEHVSNSSSVQTSQLTSHALLLGNIPFQAWDTPGFDITSDGQRIKSDIKEWFQYLSLNQSKRKNDDLYQTPPTIQVVWCMLVSDIDDMVAWQQFYDVYEECSHADREIVPLIALNQTTSVQSLDDLERLCIGRLRQSYPSANLPQILTGVRKHGGMSSPEYKEDSQAARRHIHQRVLDLLKRPSYQGLGRSYRCDWVIDPSVTTGAAIVCGQVVKVTDAVRHTHLSHIVAGPDEEIVCHWKGCRLRMKKERIIRHIQARHIEKNYTCPVCGGTFSRYENVARHFQMHFSDVEYH